MILIVGLGNPGKKYQKTRHNLGFLVLDAFKKEQKFSSWQNKTKLKAKITEGKITGKKIILAEPQTYMNNSGLSTKAIIANYQLPIPNLWVVHDDLDIPLGQFKISKSRGSAGHKGVQSIINELGTKNFVRFRVGIKSVNSERLTVNNIEKFVLEKFDKKEEEILKQVIKKTCGALELAIKKGMEKARNNLQLGG